MLLYGYCCFALMYRRMYVLMSGCTFNVPLVSNILSMTSTGILLHCQYTCRHVLCCFWFMLSLCVYKFLYAVCKYFSLFVYNLWSLKYVILSKKPYPICKYWNVSSMCTFFKVFAQRAFLKHLWFTDTTRPVCNTTCYFKVCITRQLKERLCTLQHRWQNKTE